MKKFLPSPVTKPSPNFFLLTIYLTSLSVFAYNLFMTAWNGTPDFTPSASLGSRPDEPRRAFL